MNFSSFPSSRRLPSRRLGLRLTLAGLAALAGLGATGLAQAQAFPNRPISVIGNRSLAKPGSMPVVKHEAPPAAQASAIGSIQFGGFRCIFGHTHGVIAVEHTSIPARRNRPITSILASAFAAVGP